MSNAQLMDIKTKGAGADLRPTTFEVKLSKVATIIT